MEGIRSVIIITSVVHPALREMLNGVLRYSHERGHWRIYQDERRKWVYRFRDWAGWGADAVVVADHIDEREARKIARLGLPVVVLLQPHRMHLKRYPLSRFPRVLWNSASIGRMAARYFIDRGYANFAFVDDTDPKTYWSAERERAFRMTLPPKACYRRYGGAPHSERRDWTREHPRMCAWLRELPKPCAVFAPNDRRGKQVLDACFAEGIAVPDEVAVLATDNDDYICEACLPTLSSIRFSTEQAGFEIAAILDGMMHGVKDPPAVVSVEPVEVVARQSTNWTSVRDDKVARVLNLIAAAFADPDLNVPRLAQAAGLSRRTLEIRFKNATGITILAEIERVRLAKANTLLQEGRLRVAEVAKAVGYASATQFGRRFAKAFGILPRHVKQQARA